MNHFDGDTDAIANTQHSESSSVGSQGYYMDRYVLHVA